MTRTVPWKTGVTLLIVGALLATPLALASEDADPHPGARGRDRADVERVDAAPAHAEGEDAEDEDDEEEERRGGRHARAPAHGHARNTLTDGPPGLLVALEHVPDVVKDRLMRVLERIGDARELRGDAGHDEDEEEEVAHVEDAAASSAAEHADHAEQKSRGHGNALERVPAFVVQKLTAAFGVFR